MATAASYSAKNWANFVNLEPEGSCDYVRKLFMIMCEPKQTQVFSRDMSWPSLRLATKMKIGNSSTILALHYGSIPILKRD